MAYKPVQYDFFNPMEELVPLVNMYNKAYQAQDSRLNEYIDWLSSSSELLNRDEQAMELKRKYENDLNTMADALAVGDLRTAHSVNPRTYLYPLKVKQKQAEELSNAIKEQQSRRSKYAFSRVFDENTPLGSSPYTYDEVSLDDIERNGMAYGKDLNELDPEITGQLFNGAVSILSQGYTQQDVIDMIANGDAEIMNRINGEIQKYGISDKGEQTKIKNAFINGMLRQIGVSKSHMSNPRTARQVALEAREDARLKLQDAMDEFNRTGGDYNSLKEIGEAREWEDDKGQTWVAIGSNNYKTRPITDEEAKQKALRENPSLSGDEEALAAAAEKYKNQRIAYGGAYTNAGATRPDKEQKQKSDLEILAKDKYLSNKVRPIVHEGVAYGFAEGDYMGNKYYIPNIVNSNGEIVQVSNLLIDDFIDILIKAGVKDETAIRNSITMVYGDSSSNPEVQRALNTIKSKLQGSYVKNQKPAPPQQPRDSTTVVTDTIKGKSGGPGGFNLGAASVKE